MAHMDSHFPLVHHGIINLQDTLGSAPQGAGDVQLGRCPAAEVLRRWPVEMLRAARSVLHTMCGPGIVERSLLGPHGALRGKGSPVVQLMRNLILDGDLRPFLWKVDEQHQAHMAGRVSLTLLP